MVASFVVSTLLLFCGGAWLYGAAAVLTMGVLASVSQFVFYWGWFDYCMKDFKLLTSDQNGLLTTPRRIVNEVRQIAEQLGYRPAIVPFPFGGGATDAASFLRIGVPALPILGMDCGLIRDGLVYHTPQDRVENIDRRLVEATMKIMLAYILARDEAVDS